MDLVAVRLGDVHMAAVRRDRGAEAVDLPGDVKRRAGDRMQAAVGGDRQRRDCAVGVARRRPDRPTASGHIDEAAVRGDHNRTRIVDPDSDGRGRHERQRAIVGSDREDGNRGRRLGRVAVRRQQELAIRGEAEAGRLVAAGRRVAEGAQCAVIIDRIAPDRVVAGVGDIDVTGVGADRDAVGILADGERRARQRRQRAVVAVEGGEAPVTALAAVAHVDAAVGACVRRQHQQQEGERESAPRATCRHGEQANPGFRAAQGEPGVLGHHLDG